MDLNALIEARSARAGVATSEALVAALARYVDLLKKWNRRVNLTALAIDPPQPEAIDRLIVEPLRGATLLDAGDRQVLDIGSGGGSPAIPMQLAAPGRHFVLVEVKERKSAFLREVIRELGLMAEVRTSRAEDLPDPQSLDAFADLVTVRAVKLDDAVLGAIRRQLRPEGRLLWFRSTQAGEAPDGVRFVREHAVSSDNASRIVEARVVLTPGRT